MVCFMWIISNENTHIQHHVDNYLDDVFGAAPTANEAQAYMSHMDTLNFWSFSRSNQNHDWNS